MRNTFVSPRATWARCLLARPCPNMAALLPVAAVWAATDWDTISPLLAASFGDKLPTPPSAANAAAMFDGVVVGGGAPFAAFTITAHEGATSVTNTWAEVDAGLVACHNETTSMLVAGPSVLCDGDPTCKGSAGLVCKGAVNTDSVQLNSHHGASGWAPASSHPSFMQYTFPALPAGASSITLRYEIDQRYRPELYGGNPCPNASATFNCDICIAGPWDYTMPAGVHIIWSAAGRDSYVIAGPYSQLGAAFDAGEFTQVVSSPAGLGLSEGDYPVVTFLVFNQYSGSKETSIPTWYTGDQCMASWSNPDPYPLAYRNTALFMKSATLLYRQSLVLPSQPLQQRPRLFGSDSTWLATRDTIGI